MISGAFGSTNFGGSPTTYLKARPNHIDRYLPLLTAAIAFVVYVLTLLPGVGYSGDTGKFQFVGKVLGIPHEPGSPTYVVLNYLFVTIVPLGSTAFKANLLSALFSAMTLFVLAKLLILLKVRRFVAATVALLFGFTYTLWSQSVIAEVYTLSTLFLAMTLFFFIRWHLLGRHRDFLIGCAVYSISFGNHLIVVTLLPALVYLVWVTRKEYFRTPRIILQVLLLIALGAAQYGYLIWRSYTQDATYLEILVPDLRSLWYYTTGGQFQSNFLAAGWKGVIFERIPHLLRLLGLEFLFLMILAVGGFIVLRFKPVRNVLLLGAVGTFVFNLIYVVPDIFVYMLPIYLVLTVGMGVGLDWLIDQSRTRSMTVVNLAMVLLPLSFIVLNYTRVDQSKNVEAQRIVEESLGVVKKNALIVCPTYDYAEYFWYYTFVERRASDSLYVLFSHAGDIPLHELEPYIERSAVFTVPHERRMLPPGLTVYYSTAYQRRLIDNGRQRYPQGAAMMDEYRRTYVHQVKDKMIGHGFRFTQVASHLYRIDKPGVE